jgi:DNA excision repair protein ERCC-2
VNKDNLNVEYFPYNFRETQLELFNFIQKNILDNNLIINAPTGYGKTIIILSSILPIAKELGKKIIWATKTGAETDRPIEELKMIDKHLVNKQSKVFGISIRGKKDMCLLKRMLSEDVDYDEVSLFCKTKIKNNQCRYYSRLLYEYVPYQEAPLLYSEVLNFAEKYEICPYYYQLSQIYDADVIAVNYNYIFNEQISWTLRNKINFKDVILVVDEAHNLQFLITSLNQKEITLGTIRGAIKEMDEYRINNEEIRGFLNKLEKEMLRIMTILKERGKEDVPIKLDKVVEKCGMIWDSKIGEKLLEYGIKVRLARIRENKAPRSSLYRLGEFLSQAYEMRNIDGVKIIATLKENNISFEIFDMRSSEIYSNIWEKFYRVVLCSGTLGSIKSFAEIIGLENYVGKKEEFKIKKENFLTLLTNNLSTKGEELSKEEALKYIESIESFVSSLNENIAIFSASYRIQETLIENRLIEVLRRNSRRVFIETQDMPGDKARKLLEDFKSQAYKDIKGVLLASATGKFAEGADFPGKELVGIYLVGIPFDRLTAKTYLLTNYYVKMYGRKKGIFYSYILPAIRRASHALGRAVRSPDDKAIFVLGDKRYKRFLKFLPKFSTINIFYINNSNQIKEIIKRKCPKLI